MTGHSISDKAETMNKPTCSSSVLTRFAAHEHSPPTVPVNCLWTERGLNLFSNVFRARTCAVFARVSEASMCSFNHRTAQKKMPNYRSRLDLSKFILRRRFGRMSRSACACSSSAATDTCSAVSSAPHTYTTRRASASTSRHTHAGLQPANLFCSGLGISRLLGIMWRNRLP